jgi:uncharacterized membrane protein
MSITLPVLDSARKYQTMLVTVTTSMELLWLVHRVEGDGMNNLTSSLLKITPSRALTGRN